MTRAPAMSQKTSHEVTAALIAATSADGGYVMGGGGDECPAPTSR
jgi:hypothetical protein